MGLWQEFYYIDETGKKVTDESRGMWNKAHIIHDNILNYSQINHYSGKIEVNKQLIRNTILNILYSFDDVTEEDNKLMGFAVNFFDKDYQKWYESQITCLFEIYADMCVNPSHKYFYEWSD